MMPFFLMKATSSIKKEVIIVICVVFGIFFTPVIVLASVTNIAALGLSSGAHLFDEPKVATDAYDYGFCTYWAALRRIQTGEPIPNTWGDAHTWDDNAFLDGYSVDHTPAYGAVMETDAGD